MNLAEHPMETRFARWGQRVTVTPFLPKRTVVRAGAVKSLLARQSRDGLAAQPIATVRRRAKSAMRRPIFKIRWAKDADAHSCRRCKR